MRRLMSALRWLPSAMSLLGRITYPRRKNSKKNRNRKALRLRPHCLCHRRHRLPRRPHAQVCSCAWVLRVLCVFVRACWCASVCACDFARIYALCIFTCVSSSRWGYVCISFEVLIMFFFLSLLLDRKGRPLTDSDYARQLAALEQAEALGRRAQELYVIYMPLFFLTCIHYQ